MSKEVSIGNTIQRLEECYNIFNPVNILRHLQLGANKKDIEVINKLVLLDSRLAKKLFDLYRDILRYRKGNIVLDAEGILELLQTEFAPLINSLSSEQTQIAKSQYNNWQLEWMLIYLKDATLLDDEVFAVMYHLPVTEETTTIVKDLREEYFTDEEILEEWGEVCED